MAKLFDRKPPPRRTSTAPAARLLPGEDEHPAWRKSLLDRVSTVQREAVAADAALIEQVAPIEKRLAALRAEIDSLEAQLAPLARDRIGKMGAADAEVMELRNRLRAAARWEVEAFQRIVDKTRGNWLNNIDRFAIVRSVDGFPQSLIAAVSQSLLDSWNEAQRAGIEESDIETALDGIRKRLCHAAIELLE